MTLANLSKWSVVLMMGDIYINISPKGAVKEYERLIQVALEDPTSGYRSEDAEYIGEDLLSESELSVIYEYDPEADNSYGYSETRKIIFIEDINMENAASLYFWVRTATLLCTTLNENNVTPIE